MAYDMPTLRRSIDEVHGGGRARTSIAEAAACARAPQALPALREARGGGSVLRGAEGVVDDEAAALHEGVADGLPAVGEAELPQRLRHGRRRRGHKGDLLRGLPPVQHGRPAHEAPQQVVQGAANTARRGVHVGLRAQPQHALGIPHDAEQFATVANDSAPAARALRGALHDAVDVPLRHGGHATEPEVVERLPVGAALGEDGRPAQARLLPLQAQLLEELRVAPLLEAPLLAHVPHVLLVAGAAVHGEPRRRR
mmetsp:Transcript_276/g.786  ORF Transcript_276/g.786 Transcript_276/m.786 type:complete len:254 (+) Transcript_276:170-931(+)